MMRGILLTLILIFFFPACQPPIKDGRTEEQAMIKEANFIDTRHEEIYKYYLKIDPNTPISEIKRAIVSEKDFIFKDDGLIERFQEIGPNKYTRLILRYEKNDQGDTIIRSKEEYFYGINDIEDSRAVYNKIKGAKSLEEIERISGHKLLVQKVCWDEHGQKIRSEYAYQTKDGNRIKIDVDANDRITLMEHIVY